MLGRMKPELRAHAIMYGRFDGEFAVRLGGQPVDRVIGGGLSWRRCDRTMLAMLLLLLDEPRGGMVGLRVLVLDRVDDIRLSGGTAR